MIPAEPEAPCPLKRMRWPSVMPLGILTLNVRPSWRVMVRVAPW